MLNTKTLSTFAIVALVGTPAMALDSLSIMVPSGPGGGWDQTARAIQSTLQAEGLVSNIQVENVTGAGGTVGLQQFINTSTGDPNASIMAGYAMVATAIANQSPVDLLDTTPIARLTGEYVIVVVPANSEIENAQDLADALMADPGAVTWAGGAAGGVDHIAAGIFAQSVGVDPELVNYIPYAGGGEALTAILGNQVTVGISGYAEFAGQVEAGAVRAIGITAADRQEYAPEIPTFVEQGFDVDVQNWRMLSAAPGITEEEKAEMVSTIREMAESDTWAEVLAERGWVNTYLDGDEFDTFVTQEIETTRGILQSVGLAE